MKNSEKSAETLENASSKKYFMYVYDLKRVILTECCILVKFHSKFMRLCLHVAQISQA